jgi:PhnB protein
VTFAAPQRFHPPTGPDIFSGDTTLHPEDCTVKSIQPYLTFDGNAREAMTFYQRCLGGELMVQTFGESDMPVPPGSEGRVVHARVTLPHTTLMASDTLVGMPFTAGNNFSVSIDCESMAEIQKLFAAFSQGGNITMPLQDTFWNAHFGMITDRFGINWMFNFELKPAG